MPTVEQQFTFHSQTVADSIALLPRQLSEAWQEASAIRLPESYRKAKNIIFCGMGGSNLASELIRGLFVSEIKMPFVLVRNYDLPAFANKDSLVIVSSYSGNTEESISCLRQAIKLKARIVCISAGGKVAKIAKEKHLPLIFVNAKSNPSKQPRYAVGSQLGAVLAVLNKCNIIKIKDLQIKEAAVFLEKLNGFFKPTVFGNKNLARNTAKKIKGRLPVIMAADFLIPCAHILSNQINESAKTLATYNAIPELNHHLMEGLELPKEVIKNLKIIFLNSELYSKEIKDRFAVTQKVLEKKKIKYLNHTFATKDKLYATLEALSFGSWFSFYLSQINHKDPTLIPWVDYFKAKLKKMK